MKPSPEIHLTTSRRKQSQDVAREELGSADSIGNMSEEENQPATAADESSVIENPDEPKRPERIRIPHLLQRPFDIRSFALTGLFVLALFYTMYFMRAVLLPIVLALLLSYLFKPLLRGLGKWGVRPAFASALLLLGLIAIIAYAISFLAVPAAGWLEKAPYGLQQLQQKLVPLRKPIAQVAKASGEIDKLTAPEQEIDPAAPATAVPEPAPAPAPMQVEVKQARMTDSLLGGTPEFIISAVLLLILLYFLLAYDEVFLAKLIKMLPRLEDKKRAVSIAHEIESHISRYLLTITLVNCGLGLAVGTTVGLLGLSNPIMWGVMVAVLNFVPYLGALAGILAMTVGAVLSYDSLGYAMLFPASYLVIATLEGNLITPWVMGRSLTLNPVIILLSLTFWGWMWGITGVIVAVPILAAFKIFCAHVKEMEPVAEFLS